MGAVAWRKVFVWALAGTAIAVALTLANLASTFDSLGGLVDAGPNDKAAPILAADLPDYPLAEGGRHDGQQYYVIARQPLHPTEAAVGLDRPRYRLQRIMFPVLAWALQPTGGGEGLVWAMFAVGVAGVVAGAVATGALSMQLGGPAWPAIVFGLWTGTTTALRISTPDPLALAFVLWALWFLLREQLGWAVALAVAAVLTRETGLVLLFGFFLWKRDRSSAIATIVPAVVAGAWWLWLRAPVPRHREPGDRDRPALPGVGRRRPVLDPGLRAARARLVRRRGGARHRGPREGWAAPSLRLGDPAEPGHVHAPVGQRGRPRAQRRAHDHGRVHPVGHRPGDLPDGAADPRPVGEAGARRGADRPRRPRTGCDVLIQGGDGHRADRTAAAAADGQPDERASHRSKDSSSGRSRE